MAYDICIRGAGMVGRSLALLLAREQLQVALTESTATVAKARDVRAYSINAASRGLLQELRCWPESPAVTPVQAMEIFGDAGGQVRFHAAHNGVFDLNWMVDVPVLEERLAAAVEFQPGIDRVTEPVAAALTVVCEGRASQTRAELGVSFETTAYDQYAVAARLRCEHPHAGVAKQWFRFGSAPGLSEPQAEVLALLPMGGDQGTEIALVWSVHSARARELASMDAAIFAHELQQACGDVTGALELRSERSLWPLQMARATRWVGSMPGVERQSFALAGDAAHTVHPLAGQGLNLGLADVAVLVHVIRHKEFWRPLYDLKLLRRYERARATDTLAMGAVTHGLHSLFSQSAGVWPMLRNWGLNGFDRAGPLKHWVARQAMGTSSFEKTSS